MNRTGLSAEGIDALKLSTKNCFNIVLILDQHDWKRCIKQIVQNLKYLDLKLVAYNIPPYPTYTDRTKESVQGIKNFQKGKRE